MEGTSLSQPSLYGGSVTLQSDRVGDSHRNHEDNEDDENGIFQYEIQDEPLSQEEHEDEEEDWEEYEEEDDNDEGSFADDDDLSSYEAIDDENGISKIDIDYMRPCSKKGTPLSMGKSAVERRRSRLNGKLLTAGITARLPIQDRKTWSFTTRAEIWQWASQSFPAWIGHFRGGLGETGARKAADMLGRPLSAQALAKAAAKTVKAAAKAVAKSTKQNTAALKKYGTEKTSLGSGGRIVAFGSSHHGSSLHIEDESDSDIASEESDDSLSESEEDDQEDDEDSAKFKRTKREAAKRKRAIQKLKRKMKHENRKTATNWTAVEVGLNSKLAKKAGFTDSLTIARPGRISDSVRTPYHNMGWQRTERPRFTTFAEEQLEKRHDYVEDMMGLEGSFHFPIDFTSSKFDVPERKKGYVRKVYIKKESEES